MKLSPHFTSTALWWRRRNLKHLPHINVHLGCVVRIRRGCLMEVARVWSWHTIYPQLNP